MRRKGKLFVVSGPSGVGKGTICKELLCKYPDIKLSISATTRQPRKGEIDGESYFFKTREEFMEMVRTGKMLEYAEVYGNFYGTPMDRILDVVDGGENMILEIEMDGAMQVKKKYPEAIFVFILPPSLDVLLERITGRGTESRESIATRTSAAIDEMERIHDYDYFIVNETVEESVRHLKFIMDYNHQNHEKAGADGELSQKRVLEKMSVHNNGYISIDALLERIKGGSNVTTID
ncbi:MAG: guanylate kinase [Bacillota bacterium]|nr:guanylate kinase [Bacillota bacterium]